MKRQALLAIAATAWCSIAHADPAPEPALVPSPEAAAEASRPTEAAAPDHKIAAAATLGGLYAGFAGWMYYAWYNKHKPLADYKFGGDGWLGFETYAGGEDKLGHAWATMSLARLGTELLDQWGGFDRTSSILAATAASELLFVGVEVKDGFFYEFSFSDLAGDTTGALLAFALSYWPRLDEMFDFRVQYFPSTQYEHEVTAGKKAPLGGKLNIAEDYSGQMYFLAYHLGSIKALRDLPYGTLSRFVDVAFGFDTRGYKPTPLVNGVAMDLPPSQHHQNIFLGVSLNAQGFFDWLFTGPTDHGSLRKASHALFEVFNLPFTGGPVPGLELTRTPGREPHQDGA
ncbi:MAG TPA: DUF2279 domain-containing protein [Kofleriaceae bacterium]|nr:DUF2279 domain-containing protein [Kofleriaceae bacterium]